MTTSAYLLVIHGSRNRKTKDAASQLKQSIAIKFQSKHIITQQDYRETNLSFLSARISRLNKKIPLIDIAALELATLSLSESLIEFARQAKVRGFKQVKILPLFLAPGVHVTEDIPTEIASAIQQIDKEVTVELSPFLGKYSETIELLNHKFSKLLAPSQILIAHGSRIPGVDSYYKHLGKQLNAVMAYWSTTPSLDRQVKAQIAAGHRKIAILPYFLFPGKITEAIATQVATLQAQYPEVELVLGDPLGATPALAELIVEKM